MSKPHKVAQKIETAVSSGDFKKARMLIEKLLLTKLSNEAVYWRAVCNLAEGDTSGAYKDFMEVITVNPYHSLAYYGVGLCKEKVGNIEHAISAYEVVLKCDPLHKQAKEKLRRLAPKTYAKHNNQMKDNPVVNYPAYEKLNKLLKDKRLKTADLETRKLLIKLCGKRKISTKNLKRMPRQELLFLNSIWLKNSNDKFGFSSQLDKFKMAGGNIHSSDYSKTVWDKVFYSIDWIKKQRLGTLKKSSQITFSESASSGHLPASWVLKTRTIWPSEILGCLLFTATGAIIGGICIRDHIVGYVLGGFFGFIAGALSSAILFLFNKYRAKKMAKKCWLCFLFYEKDMPMRIK